jgi:hypothetical protein
MDNRVMAEGKGDSKGNEGKGSESDDGWCGASVGGAKTS